MQNNLLATVAGKPAFPTTDNISNSERLQRDIVAAFTPKIHELLKDNPVALKNLETTPDYSSYREFFLQALRDNQISGQKEAEFLLSFPSPVDTKGARQVYDEVTFSQRGKQILSIVTGHNSTNWQDVIAADLEKFLAAPRPGEPDYRTPIGFADLRRRFLLDIKPKATPDQLDKYIKSLDDFETRVYGLRYDYYREFEALRKEAKALNVSVARLSDETAPVADGIQNNVPAAAAPTDTVPEAAQFTPSMPSSRLTPLSEEHRDQLLAHAIIEGDPWIQDGQEYRLNAAGLAESGLAPKYQITIDNQTIYLTPLFKLANEQMAAIAYIPSAGAVKVRSFYRDKAQALWRYLPDYVRNLSGEGIDFYGMGYHEKSTILPLLLQAALNQIERSRDILASTPTNPDFLLTSTAYAYNGRQAYNDAFMRNELRGDFYSEVSSSALNADSSSIIAAGHRKSAPQLISLKQGSAPNFNQPIAHYSVYSNVTGQTMGEGYPSTDNQSYWLFYADYRGRCWVANIETTSPLSSTGCRKEWLLPTDIATPLYESTILADGFGDPSDVRTGNFISMWNNYLNHIPLIQEYYNILSSRQAS